MTKAGSNSEEAALAILTIAKDLLSELNRQPLDRKGITLDSTLDRELGFDSLTRMELVSRIEKHFGVTMPERVLSESESLRDFLRVILTEGLSESTRPRFDISRIALGDTEDLPHSAQTLIDVLQWHAEAHPGRLHIQMCSDEGDGETLTYGELWEGAQKVAAGLQGVPVRPGDVVAIMLPAGSEYFFSFFGILLVGGIPAPIYPPVRISQIEDHLRRHAGILNNCLAVALITFKEVKPLAHLLKSQVQSLKHIALVPELSGHKGDFQRPAVRSQATAFLQYTSGSTGNPKGVVLTHENLLTNIRAMGERVRAGPRDVFVSWLPLYHDMGLIGAWLGSMYYAALFVVMSPLTFLARPQSWLWAIHKYRGTLSASPNFGYELCIRRLGKMELQGLDLSCWRAAFNGAEPVSPDTIQQFSVHFAPYGFRPEAMMPVYGLAESSVGLCFPQVNQPPRIDRIERDAFMREGKAIATEKVEGSLQFVSSGQPLSRHQVRIVDQADRELPERREGSLQFRGPSVTSGYIRNPDATRKLFRDDWLNSGDLAYIAGGDVYLTGRSKDIIIRAGRNIYPHELEEAVGNLNGIRAGRVVAFGSADAKTGTERLIVLAETHQKASSVLEALRSSVNSVVTDLAGTPPDEVVLAPPGTVLKTSSGKVRRAATRELFERGHIGKAPKAVWWQVTRMVFGGGVAQCRRLVREVRTFSYALYARSVFWVLAPPVWLLSVLLPRLSWRWGAMRLGAHALARGTLTPVLIQGLEKLPPEQESCIYVANHGSYLDGPLLAGFLPRQFSFVAKIELLKGIVSRLFLQRIQADFVERFDVEKGVQDFQRLAAAAKKGRAYLFFPEGTFTRSPGLMPFHMGAFIAAAEAKVPVVPIAIRGTRSILRGDSWLAHRGAIQIHISDPIDPAKITTTQQDSWSVAVVLRDAAREAILKHCGEPDLL